MSSWYVGGMESFDGESISADRVVVRLQLFIQYLALPGEAYHLLPQCKPPSIALLQGNAVTNISPAVS